MVLTKLKTHPTLVVTGVVRFLVSRGLIMANSPLREIVRRRWNLITRSPHGSSQISMTKESSQKIK